MTLPAATTEEKTLRVGDEKDNMHWQSDLFILRMANRFGSHTDGWEKAISRRSNIFLTLDKKSDLSVLDSSSNSATDINLLYLCNDDPQ